MSKLLLAAVAGGAMIGAIAAAAAARKSQAAPVLPVDDELNPRPYRVDAEAVRREKLDRDGRLRERTVVKETVKSAGVEAAQFSDATGVISDLDPAVRRRIADEHARALEAQQKAQQVAAAASAAVAAAQLLREKELESKRKSEVERAQARDLEEAARMKLVEAKEAERLSRKEHAYLTDAEREAQKLLKEQEVLMREAARHEEKARGALAVAEHDRLAAIRSRQVDIRRRLEAAEAVKKLEEERFQREQQAAEADRRLAEAERATKAKAAEEAARLRSEADQARRRHEEAARAMEQARQLADNAAREERRKAEALRNVENIGAIDTKVQALLDRGEFHKREAQAALARKQQAEIDAANAAKAQEEAQSVSQRLSSWWRGEGSTVTAVADAKGVATATPVIDAERRKGTSEGLRVDAAGTAKVDLVETPAPVFGGRLNADVEASRTDRDAARSEIRMAESARDIGNVAPVKPRAID